MNNDKIERFDTEYFKKLNKKDKEQYFLQYIRKALNTMVKGGDINAN